MSLAVFNRLVAIIENGTYAGASLGAKALRTFPDSIDPIAKPTVLILPRGETEWVTADAWSYQTRYAFDLLFYIKQAKTGNDAIGLADAHNFNDRATLIFLARPQLQLAPVATYPDIPEIEGRITWQTTSNLAVPIAYPPSSVSSGQGASYYWGFTARITVPYRISVNLSLQG